MDIEDLVRDSVGIEQVAERLGIAFGPGGEQAMASCPIHKGKTPSFRIDRTTDTYYCFGCGNGGDIITLVEDVRNIEVKDALRWLAREFNAELLPLIERAGELPPEQRERCERGSLYGLVYQYGRRLLYEPPGKKALDYLLTVRGYERETLKRTEWIYYPPKDEIVSHLLSCHPEADQGLADRIGNLPLLGHRGDRFRIALPYRDRWGVILGMLERSIDPDVEKKDRWDSSAGLSQVDLFNLHACRGAADLLMVEGYPDAVYLSALGLATVAVGQGAFRRRYIDGLKAFNVKSITLAFDNDASGPENTERALEVLDDAGIKMYVLNPPLMMPHKDPDEYVKAKEIEAFKELLRKAESGSVWRLKRIVDRTDRGTPWGKRDAWNNAVEYVNTIEDPLDEKDCRSILKETFPDLSDVVLDQHLDDYREKKARAWERQSYRELAREIENLSTEGKIDEIRDILPERIISLRAQSGARKILSPPSLNAYLERLRIQPEGLQTGFPSLDACVTIQQGTVTVVAGRPSHGTTTLLLNLMVNMIKNHPDKAFFLFSYEQTQDQLITNLLTILSGEIIEPWRNVSGISGYLKSGLANREKIEMGKDLFRAYTQEGRLWIIDEPYYADDLGNIITHLSHHQSIGAVFIDYIQKVKIKGRYDRYAEIKKISGSILETAKSLNIPIILGEQLNRAAGKPGLRPRLDDLRESGDIEQDASLVIGLYNEAVEKVQDGGGEIPERMALELTVLKNRSGVFNKSVTLDFHGPTLRITDGNTGKD